MDPYLQLGVSFEAADAEIRKAYLKQISQYPPETAPLEFEAARTAYDLISTAEARNRYRYSSKRAHGVNLGQLTQKYLRLPGRLKAPGTAALHEYLSSCLPRN